MSITSKSKQGKEIVPGDVFIDFYGDSSVHVVLNCYPGRFCIVTTLLDQKGQVSVRPIYNGSIYEVASKTSLLQPPSERDTVGI